MRRLLGFSEFLNHRSTQASLRADGSAGYVSDPAGIDRCNLYLRLEHLADDLPQLEAGIGISLGPLEHVNRSERGAYQAYYCEADKGLVGDIFAEDIARFGYRFG